MGTWSAGIFGNDSSCEVKEYFYEKYNCGEEIATIRADILSIYSNDINDQESDERSDILLALAYCLWETKALDSDLLKEIELTIKNGQTIQISKRLGADKAFIKSREAALQKYWAKISNPRDKARARKKPPVEIDSIYRNGACLAFRYNDGYWGCLIVAESKYFKRKIEGHFLQTDLHSMVMPTSQQVLKAHILDNNTYHKSNLEDHCNCFGSMLSNRQDSKTIKNFYEYSERFFTVIGYLSVWENSYKGSFGGRNPYSLPTYEEFKKYNADYLKKILECSERTSETIEQINADFESGKSVK